MIRELVIRQIRVMKASLRDRLVQGYKHGIRQGWADMEDRKNMENIYKQYHILGGNGICGTCAGPSGTCRWNRAVCRRKYRMRINTTL